MECRVCQKDTDLSPCDRCIVRMTLAWANQPLGRDAWVVWLLRAAARTLHRLDLAERRVRRRRRRKARI
jgi:hypothetical protein